jgi:hypothetical protein
MARCGHKATVAWRTAAKFGRMPNLCLHWRERFLKWISAGDLEQWSKVISARDAFPAMVADLIRASAQDIASFRFPSGDKGQVRGFDGHLVADGSPPFVPDGVSIWEFGISDGVGKANADYQKRVNEMAPNERVDIAFVFVTLQTLDKPGQKLEDWERVKREAHDWKSVHFIDGMKLEHWLDEHPAVAARYARTVLGVFPQLGVLSTDEFWNDYSNRYGPQLTEEVLLCEREKQVEDLLTRLGSEASQVTICADSLDEVIAFAVAAIRKADPQVRRYLEARTLIIESEDAARFLREKPSLIFFPRGQAQNIAGSLARSGPTLVAMGADRPNRNVEVLPRPSRGNLGKAIATMGFEEDRAYDLARRCGRSVTILRRLIPGGVASTPEWTSHGRILLPALLAGGWDSQSVLDREVIGKLATVKTYFAYEAEIRNFKRMQDSPLDQEQNIWKVRAPVDAFVHIGHLIGVDDLDRLKEAATAVFSHIEPMPDPNEPFRLESRLPTKHSEWLRDGLATTLLLIAALGEQADLDIPGRQAQAFVDDIIRSLPGLSSDHRVLASLRQELPLLAEAAPGPLLSALERMLEGEGAAIRPIFAEATNFLAPSSPHTGLLWALETLAWDPTHLRRVALILAKLARIDPSGRLSNRPINSLRAIFLSWTPCTNAPLRVRLAAIDTIIAREPAIGWELIVQLLPRDHDTSGPTAQPRFREAGASERETLTYGLIWESQREIVSKALDLVGDNPSRWITIIKELSNFEPPLRASALILVDDFLGRPTQEGRYDVWAALHDELNRHRTFAKSQWALPSSELAQFEEIVKRYQPSNPIESEAWLFDDWSPDIPGKLDSDGGVINVRDDVVETARREAICKVLDHGGTDAVLALAGRVRLPQFVATAAVTVANDLTLPGTLIVRTVDRSKELDHFAAVTSSAAVTKFGDTWIEEFRRLAVSQDWSADSIAMLLARWPDDRSTWLFVTSFGPDTELSYWRRKTSWIVQGDREDVIYVARQYLKVGRPTAALDALYNRTSEVPADLVFELLDAAIGELNAKGIAIHNMFAYHLEHVFKSLEARDDVPKIDIARREYAYLPLLDHRDGSLTLHRLMAESAEFFVSILCDIYRKATEEPKDPDEPTKEKQDRARAGYQLLRSFKLVPGLSGDALDIAVLRAWIVEVRRRGAEEDRLVIAEQHIGHVLAHAQLLDPADDAWPHRGVRGILEELNSEQIERGIVTERLNMRGAHWKAIYEGGKRERELGKEYRAWANAALAWSRTSALLEKIAEWWERDADAADVRARQDKMRE